MTRPYFEVRNKLIMVLVERRKIPPKKVPSELIKLGFEFVSYGAIRAILHRMRRGRKEGASA